MGEYFTTHDIALMLNVTRVTVRNWIIKGRLAATTTPGGHRRISRQELTRFMEANNYDPETIREYELTRRKRFVYCWEYHHKGFVNLGHEHQCSDCLVSLLNFANRKAPNKVNKYPEYGNQLVDEP